MLAVQLPELLTLQQAAQILKVHPNTLRNWERSGLIPVVRVGPRRDRRFPKHGIHQFLPYSQASSKGSVGEPLTTSADASFAIPSTETEIDSAPIATEPTATVENIAQEDFKDSGYSEEAPHVIVNVPSKQPFVSVRAILGVIVVALSLAAFALFIRQFGYVQPSLPQEETPGFAIRRNPPSVMFADGFESYEVGSMPRPTWNTIGLWEVAREDGQRFLRGKEEAGNPLNLKSHVYTGNSSWKDYKFKFSARIVTGKEEIAALVDYLDENNYYLVKFGKRAVSATLMQEGREHELGSAPFSGILPGQWTTFTIDLFGPDRIDIYVNGDRVLGLDNSDLTSGKVGILVDRQIVDFDHVQVIQLTGKAYND